LHIEIDRFPDDGIDLEGLRAEWNSFWDNSDARPLAAALNLRAAKRPGVVLSLPSGVVPTTQHSSTAQLAGFRTLVLYGTGAECLSAFIERERVSGRGLGVDHWIRNNAHAYACFSTPDFAPHRLSVFDHGQFRSRGDLVAEVAQRLG
jgi:hypothetical protein